MTTDVPVTVTVRAPPQFATQPSNYASPCGSTDWVSFSVTPSSSTAVASYQWYSSFNNTTSDFDLNTSRYYQDAMTSTLMVAPQTDTYVWCTMTDVCGVPVSSTHAMLAIVACTDPP